MVLEEYLPSWVTDYLSPIVLLIGGILALVIVASYLKDKESTGYKAAVALGFIVGVAIVLLAFVEGYKVQVYTLVLIAVAAFALIIRPIREIHVAVIIGMMVMVLVYILLGNLNGYILMDKIDLTPISEGWPRLIIAFVAGAIVYGLLNFAEAIVKFTGKVLNFWPILLILGLICIAEACCIYLGYGSIFDYVNQIPWEDLKPKVPSTDGIFYI